MTARDELVEGGMVTELRYLPDGMEPDDYNSHIFQVIVCYRGRGKYAVATSRECFEQLTSTGKWLFMPLKMTQMRHCRFDFPQAVRLARSAVNRRVVNGRTWAERQASRPAPTSRGTSS